ncbi:C-X-C motif chemokine 10-like [Thunnus albacares]|uniref:C-X-C motif chemokine 10-like n=1 Tax=Thunnus albacares TaxID=8236 RepID=UPI001CF68330|nr:C-X-C motif chemokine 10-like [Thunnus albacares]XP_044194798.1 C-X-C motif chemokine 10-like [Thunnus albacares]
MGTRFFFGAPVSTMSSIVKVILLLAVMVSVAQMDEGGRCLCHSFVNLFHRESEIKDIQILPATPFCDRVEILVIKNNGLRFCLNPKLKAVKRLMDNILRKQRPSTTAQTTQLTTPVSTASTPSSGD